MWIREFRIFNITSRRFHIKFKTEFYFTGYTYRPPAAEVHPPAARLKNTKTVGCRGQIITIHRLQEMNLWSQTYYKSYHYPKLILILWSVGRRHYMWASGNSDGNFFYYFLIFYYFIYHLLIKWLHPYLQTILLPNGLFTPRLLAQQFKKTEKTEC